MDIKEILKKEFIGEKFKDNHNRIWGVVSQGGCRDKQSLILTNKCGNDDTFIGYEIDKLLFLSDIVNLKFEKVENKETREVECPYCYAIYNIDECGTSFECGSCESSLDVEFDKDGKPYIESQ